jgi:hypothetical protein
MKYSNNNKGVNRFYKTNLKNINFTIEDLHFENYSNWVKTHIDLRKKYIAIGLDQGCHFAKYFCNQYQDNCIALYILIDRNFTKKSYENTFHSIQNYDFIKNIVDSNKVNEYQKYIIENLTNDIIKNLLNKIKKLEDNEKYIDLLSGLCKGIIRSQYDKIQQLNVNTIIYSDAKTLTPQKIEENIEFNKKSNNNILYYYVIDDNDYLIHGKYADEIYNNIFMAVY